MKTNTNLFIAMALTISAAIIASNVNAKPIYQNDPAIDSSINTNAQNSNPQLIEKIKVIQPNSSAPGTDNAFTQGPTFEQLDKGHPSFVNFQRRDYYNRINPNPGVNVSPSAVQKYKNIGR